jgi:hypothetical protein
MSIIIDTNVPLVANDLHPAASQRCREACVQALADARSDAILLDADYEILSEYAKYLSHSGQPGLGDAFFRWLWANHTNPEHCRLIAITAHADRGYFEFPDEPALETFDRSDRKFVAVALASGEAPQLLNATDSDWWEHHAELTGCGVHITFLCPDAVPGNDA